MAVQHKKNPTFIKIIVDEKQLVCVNPAALSSFQAVRQAPLVRSKSGAPRPISEDDVESYTADVIRLYYPTGQGMSYEVGRDITPEMFDYIVEVLNDWIYLTRPELEAIAVQRDAEQLAAWNEQMGTNTDETPTTS